MKALCFALFACAFNLLIGYVGLLSFGHALYFGWASYVSAYAAKVWGLPPELAILLGTRTAAVFGARRRRARHPAAGHLLCHDHARARADDVFLRGAGDVHRRRGRHPGGAARQAVRPPRLADQMTMYVIVLVIFLAGFLLIYRIIHSPFGEVLKAIRENEARAISLGYKTDRYKLLAFVLSATLAGLAGATKAIVFQLASLTDVDWPMSGEVVLMTLLGGLGTVFGPVVGAFFMVTSWRTISPSSARGCSSSRAPSSSLRAPVPPRHRRRTRQLAAHSSLVFIQPL